MEIVMRKTVDIKPYEKNAKKHPKEQVEYIANSILSFGWQKPIVIDANDEVICGHGSLLAAKKLNLKEVPCKVADNLTEEQIKAYRLADNEVSKSGYNTELIKEELQLIDLDMADFGFDYDEIFKEKPIAGYKQTKNLENFFRTDFEFGDNWWGIPETKPFTADLEGIEWVSFGEKAKIKDRSNVGIHFYIDDYKFESVWTQPDKWIELFQQCRAVVTPDFSNYTDMPKALQLYSQYKRQWCARYWQDRGVNVVSSLSWAIGQIEDWTFAGITQGTSVASSFVGNEIDKQAGIDELLKAIELINPCNVYIKANSEDEKTLRKHLDFKLINPYNWG